MSALPLFYVPKCYFDQEVIRLEGAQANHIVGSRRLRENDCILLTNGQGLELTALIDEVGPRQKWVELHIQSSRLESKPKKNIILASAVAKGDRQATIVDMACQLGVSEIWPVQFEHSVSKAGESQVARWQRIAIEACKQSRRLWFPQIKPIVSLNDVLGHVNSSVLWLAHQNGSALNELSTNQTPHFLIVGPEAGLSALEFSQCETAGVQFISLGKHILRIETACSAIIAAVNQMAE